MLELPVYIIERSVAIAGFLGVGLLLLAVCWLADLVFDRMQKSD